MAFNNNAYYILTLPMCQALYQAVVIPGPHFIFVIELWGNYYNGLYKWEDWGSVSQWVWWLLRQHNWKPSQWFLTPQACTLQYVPSLPFLFFNLSISWTLFLRLSTMIRVVCYLTKETKIREIKGGGEKMNRKDKGRKFFYAEVQLRNQVQQCFSTILCIQIARCLFKCRLLISRCGEGLEILHS